ncbi:MAG TPA: hypothetical protein VLN45_05530 [Ignavibacteriaceae bacterium]|nr:hypothetical protein [Ignavibacteriaceae bacterium]
MFKLNNIFDLQRWIVILFILFYSFLIFITGWLCDDAFITFRTVDNFINGFGLTWNISERVQAYTHPLWMFLLSAFYFFTGDVYFTTIIISILLSIVAVTILVFYISENYKISILVLIALIFSKSFIDYSTSGLENPLSYFLVVLFYYIYLKKENNNKKILSLALITSIIALNRFDLLLLLLPALFYNSYKTARLKSIPYLIAGFIPLILWLLFSLFYYGFPFPNTAYAKLNTGISQVALLQQGLYYVLNSIFIDPLTILLIILTILISFIKRKSNLPPVSIGILLYLIYVIKIGGDFMSGRFFSVSFLITAIIISQIEFRTKLYTAFALTIILLGLLAPYPTIFSTTTYGLGPKLISGFKFGPKILATYDNGIADERLFYYQFTGLLKKENFNKHPWLEKVKRVKENHETPFVYTIAGIFGYYAGPEIYIIDPWALTNPLLSKLRATEYWRVGSKIQPGEKWWRIGHFARKIPDGYIETLYSEENKIKNPDLKKYYDKLSFVIKGNLFNSKRLIEVWNLNIGKYDYLIDRYNSTLTNNAN